jgi:hypothetical protein
VLPGRVEQRGQQHTHYKGRDTPKDAPARKWRARGRIEQTLLDGEFSVRPNRPKTFARNPTLPQEMTNVSIHDKGPEPELEVLGHLVRRADGIELKP